MKKEKSEAFKTVLTIITGCIVIYFFTHHQWLLYVALAVGCAALVSSHLANLIDVVWMKLAHVLSFIIPTVLLTCIFYLFLFPLSLLAKLFKKNDPLLLSNKVKSTFIIVNKNSVNKALKTVVTIKNNYRTHGG